ncbi:M20/M25/M40 family metallo-hydrolase [Ochrobactrum sp. Marseille-Q0166]|uniref:M20/M25/M40 family metallo-hydrolase n=1 Tax=Ochrobactrum sp. Marseille-Q0166 TaxID=2761105 RepID=UPI001655951C|nr:M20/M25/M40 family metallo-hydrolase [Ochrobactrum sp. Marseille-Q0166]MBC8718625.1 M20/M25/M40 family metallo-hydrolase [Ochrobactrum sp. Marseille-Q0166]
MTANVSNGASNAVTMAHNHINAQHVEELALRLVGWNSETGTPGEARFSEHLVSVLKEIPYFQQNPNNIRTVASHGDPLTHNVVALVRGKGKRTLALAGHFDTVATDNYHELKSLACESLKLKDALIKDLSKRARSAQEERALEDLLSGDFLPGRGMLDMKSGLAVGIACAEKFAEDADRSGNLLLVFTPDEERESRGMRSMRNALPAIARDFDIEIAAAINLDVTSDQGDGQEGRAVYAGTIGKLLPFALVIGLSSHASYPYEGVSAQAMAAGILARFEGNAALADRDENDISPPPICLEAKDLRDGYEVTTPERFWIALNWLYHAMTAEELFERFQTEVLAGATEAVERFAGQSEAFGQLIGKRAGATPAVPKLITFDQLRGMAAEVAGEEFEALYSEQEKRLSHIDNPLSVSRQLTEWLVGVAHLSGPAVVVGFSGLHYPASHLDDTQAKDRAFKQAIETTVQTFSAFPGQSLVWKPYFQGISDMSFLGQATQGQDVVSHNTPVARLVDQPADDALQFPVVNIGPWGREFHQKLERVHAPYAFEVLPQVVSMIAEELLSKRA